MRRGEVTAVILAAGVARRLAPLTDHTQKSLLPVGGQPILARMIDALAAVGVRHIVIVVGHCADQVEALAQATPPGVAVRCRHNPEYQKGSALSLYSVRDLIGAGPTLIMDADVVFPREFLRRLVGSTAPNCAPGGSAVRRHGRRGEDLHPGTACHRPWQEGGT